MGQCEKVIEFTSKRINNLLYEQSDPVSKASLAALRRGVGHEPGELPQVWGEFLIDMPEELLGNKKTSKAEWAVYLALTLFAMHQQGRDRKNEPMNSHGISLGTAANRLIESEDDRERVARRFYPIATASGITDVSNNLRGMISLLKSNGIPLDYPMLAGDLFLLQTETYADQVRMRWGRDFCRTSNSENQNNVQQ